MNTKWILMAGVLLVGLGGGAALVKARSSKMPTPQRLAKVFPGATQGIFENSQQFTLLSLDSSGIGEYKGKDSFRGYRILGQTQLGSSEKARIVSTFYNGMAENEDRANACFSPRHAIHAVQDGKHVDLVICFSCMQVAIYSNNKKSGTVISRSPQATFDAVLKEANVPLDAK